MVKNKKGGSGHKRQARKHVTGGNSYNRTRYAEDPLELYAVCTKVYGGGNVAVLCQDRTERLCVLRKKFKGRGKRDNTVAPGIYLLVGLREFEVVAKGKQEKCDLLEVYSEHDKKVLEQNVSEVNWSGFRGFGMGNEQNDDEEDAFEFTDSKNDEYEKLMEGKTNAIISTQNDDNSESTGETNLGDEIDIDDI